MIVVSSAAVVALKQEMSSVSTVTLMHYLMC